MSKNDYAFMAAMDFVALCVCLLVALPIWKYSECRKVGHGVARCLLIDTER